MKGALRIMAHSPTWVGWQQRRAVISTPPVRTRQKKKTKKKKKANKEKKKEKPQKKKTKKKKEALLEYRSGRPKNTRSTKTPDPFFTPLADLVFALPATSPGHPEFQLESCVRFLLNCPRTSRPECSDPIRPTPPPLAVPPPWVQS